MALPISSISCCISEHLTKKNQRERHWLLTGIDELPSSDLFTVDSLPFVEFFKMLLANLRLIRNDILLKEHLL
jgi:hypothetical protein